MNDSTRVIRRPRRAWLPTARTAAAIIAAAVLALLAAACSSGRPSSTGSGGSSNAGGSTFPIIDAVIATMRSNGSLDRALAHLSRRDEQVHHLSLRRLQASAALHAYLAKYYSPG